MKFKITVAALGFSFVSNTQSASEESTFLLCSELSDSDYGYLIFMITEDGLLYEAINTNYF